ncbi:Fucose mutarotase [Lamellibrachia satsuma]|nr:Fucose mutarotase [Lamellibrachia satsuma]
MSHFYDGAQRYNVSYLYQSGEVTVALPEPDTSQDIVAAVPDGSAAVRKDEYCLRGHANLSTNVKNNSIPSAFYPTTSGAAAHALPSSHIGGGGGGVALLLLPIGPLWSHVTSALSTSRLHPSVIPLYHPHLSLPPSRRVVSIHLSFPSTTLICHFRPLDESRYKPLRSPYKSALAPTPRTARTLDATTAPSMVTSRVYSWDINPVLADAHFPTSSICRCGPREIRADGHDIPRLLEAILRLFPLDTYATPVTLMSLVPEDKARGLKVTVWKKYKEIAAKAEGREVSVQYLERFEFYERAKKAFAVVHTGETAQYGNIIIKKGVVLQED